MLRVEVNILVASLCLFMSKLTTLESELSFLILVDGSMYPFPLNEDARPGMKCAG